MAQKAALFTLYIPFKDCLFDLYLNLKQWHRINKFSISSKLVYSAYSLSLSFMGFIITAVFIDFNDIVLKPILVDCFFLKQLMLTISRFDIN
jgi:hypothetical protein